MEKLNSSICPEAVLLYTSNSQWIRKPRICLGYGELTESRISLTARFDKEVYTLVIKRKSYQSEICLRGSRIIFMFVLRKLFLGFLLMFLPPKLCMQILTSCYAFLLAAFLCISNTIWDLLSSTYVWPNNFFLLLLSLIWAFWGTCDLISNYSLFLFLSNNIPSRVAI